MVRYDEVVRTMTAEGFSLDTVGVHADAQHPKAQAREEHDVPGQTRQSACASRGQRHDGERDQGVEGKEQEDGDGFKKYSHEGDAVDPTKKRSNDASHGKMIHLQAYNKAKQSINTGCKLHMERVADPPGRSPDGVEPLVEYSVRCEITDSRRN
jgi:hypothetical protein